MSFTAENYVVAKITTLEQETNDAHALLDIRRVPRQDPAWGRLTLVQRTLLSLGEALPPPPQDPDRGYHDE